MKRPNDMENSRKLDFESIFITHKKIFFAVPLVVVGVILTLYFMKPVDKKDSQENNNVDVSLPSAQTKELSDSKLDVLSDFENLNEAKKDEESKGDNFNGEAFPTDVVSKTETYQQPDDEVVKKVNKMLGEMNRHKKQSNTTSRIEKPISEPIHYPQNNDDNSKTSTREVFDDFFSDRPKTTTSKVVAQQNDLLIYAVIKGDHLGLKNNQRVTMILPKDVLINGTTFKKNTIIYAQATFSGSRVNFTINNINQIPVLLKVYDAEDGGLGLQVKESLIAETSSEVIADATDEVDVNGIPLGNTLKKLFKKKNQQPKIDLLNNQKVILKYQ